MMLITSWNEWNEDTAVEPVALAPATASDASDSGNDYTLGSGTQGAVCVISRSSGRGLAGRNRWRPGTTR
jgi:hypothetical protein